jgi:hypothetical protein
MWVMNGISEEQDECPDIGAAVVAAARAVAAPASWPASAKRASSSARRDRYEATSSSAELDVGRRLED